MRFGEGLKGHRERRGISLDEVAVSTRVSLRHLSALEDDRFKELPGGVFSRGIVRSYAEHCGLEPDGTVQGFVEALRASGVDADRRDDDWVEFAEAVQRSRTITQPRRRLQWIGVFSMLVAVLLLACGLLWLLVTRRIVQVPPKLDGLTQRLRVR